MEREHIGPYRVEELLGRGGMGEVYRAYDEKLERYVAIKLIRASAVRAETLKRFSREARTAARLAHSAIVQIYHVEEVDGDDCIVMELVEGEPLSRLVRQGPLSPAQCLSIARQIAAGLAEAHGKGIVHRDLKTENVMVTTEGRIKILDFGLAKPLAMSPSETVSSELIGTPRAMSPEQANEQQTDARSDLFSFATLLYEISTGICPFVGRTPLVVLHQVCFHRPPPARELNPEIPLELSMLIDHMHEKDVGDRPASVVEVLDVLERIGGTASAVTEVSPDLRLSSLRLSELHDERRQMTLLCCCVGSDPALDDPAGELLNRAPGFLSAATEIIQRHLGWVVRMAPDRVSACFGYPRAREDDAYRAARCAEEILHRFFAVVGQGFPDVPVRLVLHTDMVEISGAADSPSTGARPSHRFSESSGSWKQILQRIYAVQAGGIWLSAPCHGLVDDRFECEGPVTLAGLDGEMYRLLGFRERRGLDGATQESPLIARREELELLEERWRRTGQGRGQVVLICGEVGIGKTRLLAAFRDRLQLGPGDWWASRSSLRFQSSGLRPVVALLWQVLATERGAPPGEHRAQLEKLTASFGLSRHNALLTELLGLPAAAAEGAADSAPASEPAEAVLEFLLAMAAQRPRVWVVEDLHWTDPSSLDLIDQLIDQVPTTQLLLLLSFRPSFRAPWTARAYLTPLVLVGLDTRQARALLCRQNGAEVLPEEMVERIVRLTDGVPLFIEELTRLVIESFSSPGGRQNLTGRLRIPTTLQTTLLARLDRLGATKQIAQLASVFGREFSRDVLRAVSPFDEEILDRALDQLVDSELFYRRGISQVRYVFKHALIQQVAYESLARGERRDYHGRIAGALEDEFSDTVRLHPEVLAHHFTEAEQPLKAAFFWWRAGCRNWATLEATRHLHKALDLLAGLPEDEERLRLELRCAKSLGPLLMASKGFGAPEVKETYDRILLLERRLGESSDFKTLWGYWRFYSTAGEWSKALELARKLESVADEGGQSIELAVALRSVGGVLFHMGRLEPARRCLERGVAISGEEPAATFSFAHHPKVNCQAYAAWTLWIMGRPDQALAMATESIALARRLAEPYTLALALASACLIRRLRRENAEVLELAAEQIELAREYQFSLALAGAELFHGSALVARGEVDEGIAQMEKGLGAWTSARTSASLTFILGDLAQAYLEAERIEPALETADRALAIVDAGGESFYHSELLRLRGEVLRRQGGEAEASQCFARSMEVAVGQGALAFELRSALSLGRYGQPGLDARRQLAEVHHRFTEGFETADWLESADFLGS